MLIRADVKFETVHNTYRKQICKHQVSNDNLQLSKVIVIPEPTRKWKCSTTKLAASTKTLTYNPYELAPKTAGIAIPRCM